MWYNKVERNYGGLFAVNIKRGTEMEEKTNGQLLKEKLCYKAKNVYSDADDAKVAFIGVYIGGNGNHHRCAGGVPG